jgi:nucleoside-diphosphate-sugar epimerase
VVRGEIQKLNLLVVGASGFIGKNLLLHLDKRHEVVATYHTSEGFPKFVGDAKLDNVTVEKCDLRQEGELVQTLSRYARFDKCVYLASDTRVGFLSREPAVDVMNNILPMANFTKHYRGGTVLFISSGAVYMGSRGMVSPSTPLHPTIPYSISKMASELYLRSQVEGGFEGFVILRFFGAFGPYEAERKITRKLIRSILKSPTRSAEFTVYGDGNNLIDVMYVDDAIASIVKVLKSAEKNVTLDLCGGDAITVNEYATRVADSLGGRVKVLHSGTSAEYIEFRASRKPFTDTFGDVPMTSLEDAVKTYATWLEEDSRDNAPR